MAEFDQIAEVYDETRRALDEDTLKGIREMLASQHCHSILEIGVGTGRVSLPLSKSGYEMTGIDISIKMMERAKGKGLHSLFLADGRKVPFKDRSFDATIMAHVFHLLENPISVMREAARVSNIGVFALVRNRSGTWPFGRGGPAGNQSEAKLFEERREHFRMIAKKYNWDWDSSRGFRYWQRESETLETHPPDELKILSDLTVNESVEDRIARFEKGGHRFIMSMPEGMRKEIIEEMRSNASAWKPQSRREIQQIAMWKPETIQSSAV